MSVKRRPRSFCGAPRPGLGRSFFGAPCPAPRAPDSPERAGPAGQSDRPFRARGPAHGPVAAHPCANMRRGLTPPAGGRARPRACPRPAHEGAALSQPCARAQAVTPTTPWARRPHRAPGVRASRVGEGTLLRKWG